MDCVFCQIIQGAIPSQQVYADEQVYAFRDINPQAPVHVLVVPREHLPGLPALNDGHAALLLALHRAAHRVAVQEGIAERGYRLVVNSGPDAGQTVFHLHYHVLGGAPLGRFGR
ncbi:MAG: histidine triad nucleotide-binding protein [Chloroflexi bacterium]|nr:histidine triad nucleotide-binding protein [Chloroflexota bacterium]GIW09858.1 MAG: histidine triad nucleotide-binding protein [Dehalococcoidia bacterium]